jgi:hypothetical protein
LPLNERFTFALKTTLHKDGTPDTGEYEQASLFFLFQLTNSLVSLLYSRGKCSLQGKFDSHADDFHYVEKKQLVRLHVVWWLALLPQHNRWKQRASG